MFPKIYYFSVMRKKKIIVGVEHGGLSFKDFMYQNPNLSYRDMKILFYNLIKAFHTLKEKKIVHNDISPINILIESPEKVKIIDFEISFKCINEYKDNNFPIYWPSYLASELYISPELMTWRRIPKIMKFIKYDPYKSDIFSLGLCFLDILGIDIKGLNIFGINYDIHIMEMLTISYDYIAKDSLRKISYRLLREELQNAIDERIEKNPYNYLNDTLRRMLEVDIVNRATIDEIYKDAKYHVGIFD
ncbi:hypothetical protein SteCoe_32863 [Stentor coeruleus]|uniref:Protein kinase domain-containing protein n=1 Tax=Stentor coeruleus TaxID=5963 RepID=A0A1R2AY09_9CILI|nr:hypothetical protein SteCoe_32863 [Stentor coeruleus]